MLSLSYKFPMKVEFPGLGIDLTVDNVAFRIGSFEIYWYALLIMTGFALAVLYAFKKAKRVGIKTDPMITVITYSMVASIICARLYYVLFRLEYYHSLWEVINIRDGGIAIYGSLIGAFGCGYIACKANKVPVLRMFDLAAVGFLIGQGIGRWGNFVNQEAFGRATSLPWGMISERTMETVADSPVHPCFLYESVWCILGFFVIDYISKKYYKFEGQLLLCYLLWNGFGRFFIEGLRTDSLWLIPDVIRVSQLLAALFVLASVPLLVLGFKGKIKFFKPMTFFEEEKKENASDS